MTREEAKDVFLNRGFIEVEGCRGRIFHADKWREACVVISEWLKEEPCDDCISRIKAKEKKVYSHERHEYVVPVAELDWLPSVRPINKWIEVSDNYGHSSYFCSRCGTQEGKPSESCPNCDADMKNVRRDCGLYE